MNRDEWRDPRLAATAALAVLVVVGWLLLGAWLVQRALT